MAEQQPSKEEKKEDKKDEKEEELPAPSVQQSIRQLPKIQITDDGKDEISILHRCEILLVYAEKYGARSRHDRNIFRQRF